MKHGRLSYIGVVVLCISIGVLLAAVMPAAAQEDATAAQPPADATLEPGSTKEMAETPVAAPSEVDDSPVCETVRLHYVRDLEDGSKLLALQTLLESIKKHALALDVTVVVTGSPAPLVVLAGPRSHVDDIKRVIAAIDVPQPQVRLDLWAFQISGGDAADVSGRARRARELTETVSNLMRGYLRQLEACARASQQRNLETVEQAQEQASTSPDDGTGATELAGWDALLAQLSSSTKGDIAEIEQLPGQATILITPSDRGLHPLSLTETLATLLMMPPLEGLTWRQTLEQQLSESLGRWLEDLSRQDPAALIVWQNVLDAESTEQAAELSAMLRRNWPVVTTFAPVEDGADDSQDTGITPLLPETLLRTFDDPAYLELTQQTIGNFLWDAKKQAKNWRALTPPDRLSRRAADVDVVLQAGERALAADIEAIFLRPLLAHLRALAGLSGPSGLASTSSTSIVVLAGTQANVKGSALSYFELNAPPEEERLAPVGHSELPVIPLIPLVESLRTGDEPQVWGSMTEGTDLTFTPHILPGGAAAELAIAVKVTHADAKVMLEGVESGPAPLSRVAEHSATTNVYVNALDLFCLSSMMLRTTQPRAKSSVPVLGQLPLLGQMFRFSRSPLIVHHESVLLVYSTILPTGQDLAAVFDFRPVPTSPP